MTSQAATLDADFQTLRDAFKVPRDFPDAVLAETEAAIGRDADAFRASGLYADLLDVPFLTIDPPGSRDLDQAFFAAREGDGYLVRYAIADVAAFVARGGAIEAEAWRRGQTMYCPDGRTPLYPPAMSEGGASLLADQVRPSVVFSMTLDAKGRPTNTRVERALMRSRVQLAYPEVGAHLALEREQPGSGALAGHEWSPSLSLLETVGRLRQAREVERGAVNLRLPSQEVQRWSNALAGYRLAFQTATEVEDWNAQISLMTGMEAARIMRGHGAGLLRTLRPPRPDRLQALKLTARALGVPWSDGVDYDDFVRALDPHAPIESVMLHQAARVSGGAQYLAFTGDPTRRGRHAAIAAYYAHVTAPLRRLADRYVLDLLVAIASDEEPDATLLSPLADLPRAMADADQRADRLESAVLDQVELRLMQPRIGETFDATVIALKRAGAAVQIGQPPIRTLAPFAVLAPGRDGDPEPIDDGAAMRVGDAVIRLGETFELKLVGADAASRALIFARV